ncbi:Na/Pi cotransporter family protein [Candidatus Halocynthiibacter alkanivorans]|uniref:Na/Pi cotransporter family protein n=1 Tax=Candidatus Halocynthiibacter alkanivorans TaxID=2267619 RepID=UPI000DF2472D|nr:Na/Pi cotransporter family protein [Candidatus Halocynthiibacter alkanivorans]
MTIVSFVVQLMGATMLLLYAVRMVRTGIERAFGASFKRVVTTTSHPLSAAGTGLVLAVILQSSAAVAILVAGFANTGAIGFGAGIAVVLGADLGSALLIQVLSFKLEWLVPLLLAIGGGLFIKSDRRKLKQAGRILMGIAFILISLRFLRETMDPIRDSAFLPSIAGFLETDFITAFIAGAVLAWVMHSSVAVILMCVTLVSIGALPMVAGVSLVLGANLGSSLIPMWLTKNMGAEARRVPLANFLIRGSGAVLALFIVNKLPVLQYLSGMGEAQALINTHVLFNAILLLTLPVCRFLLAPVSRLLPDAQGGAEVVQQINRSVLDNAALATPNLALTCVKRELLRMAHLVETMTIPVMDNFHSYQQDQVAEIAGHETHVNMALDDIRHYVAALPKDMDELDQQRARELTEYAIALETAGDLVVKHMMPLAKKKAGGNIKFSKAGREELVNIHERVLANMALGFNVLLSDDLESARLLLEEKSEMARMERSSRKKHLKRLSDGEAISFESSNIHLEALRTYREINSHIASVAYPILYRGGQLLETRLIETISDEGLSQVK